jgi:hypothetical protein
VKKNPAVREVAKIRVAWQGDETKKGEKGIAVLEQTLKIVMIGPREVRPLIPEEIIKLPGNQGSIIPFRAMTELRVSLTYKGSQRAGHQFELSSNYVDGSGGHDHVTDRRTRNLDNYGSFSLKSNTPSRASNPYQGTTTLAEEGNVVYTASVFGDRMLFRVQSTQNPLLWDTVSIVERVVGLTPLPSGTDNLITYTSTERHHSLANSNYGQPDIVAAILRTVRSYAEEHGMASDIFLTAVDMSLPFGGLFDINGSWSSPHELHRAGESIDFSHFYRDAAGAGIFVDSYIDGQLVETTNMIDEDLLDKMFDLLDFDRKEKLIGLIHYESRK